MFNVSVSGQVPRIAVIASAPTIIGLSAVTDSRIRFGVREGTTTEGGYFHEEREFVGDMSGRALQRQSLCAALSRGIGAPEGAGAAGRDRL